MSLCLSGCGITECDRDETIIIKIMLTSVPFSIKYLEIFLVVW